MTTSLGWEAYAYGLAVQEDGKLVLAGYARQGGTEDDFALVRYEEDGRLDTSFGTDGKVTTDFGTFGDERAYSALDSTGRQDRAGWLCQPG